ncbi:MAG TPA: hypothetical protein VGJ88_04680, partial [Thermoanaerobaculia bacterium]
ERPTGPPTRKRRRIERRRGRTLRHAGRFEGYVLTAKRRAIRFERPARRSERLRSPGGGWAFSGGGGMSGSCGVLDHEAGPCSPLPR